MARTFVLSLELWLAALIAVVVFRLASGRINLRGIFVTRLEELGRVRPNFERVQHLWVTISILVAYVAETVSTSSNAAPPLKTMPDVSPQLIAAMVGTHALYLGGKLVRNL
jgi:hypothetical protein